MCGCFIFVPSDAFSMPLHLLSAWKADHYGLHPLCSRWLPVMFSQWEASRRSENRPRERFGIPTPPMPTLPSLAVAAFVQLRQGLAGQPSPVLLLLLASPCPFMPGEGGVTANPWGPHHPLLILLALPFVISLLIKFLQLPHLSARSVSYQVPH